MRMLIALYRPYSDWALSRPKAVLGIALLLLLTTLWPLARIGGEFIPALDEGDVFTCPLASGISTAKASELLH